MIFSQAHRQFVHPDRHGVGQRFDAGGVDRFHLLNQGENIIEFGQGIVGLLLGGIELRKFGQTRNIGEGQGHEWGARLVEVKILKLTNRVLARFERRKLPEERDFRITDSQSRGDYKVECWVNGRSARPSRKLP